MKLTDEQLEFIKKWMAKCEEKDEIPTNGMTIGRLLEHIEALQQENEQLQAQLTDITKIRDDYTTAARVIALYLVDFCDNSMPYDKMIADAARKACMAVEKRDEALKQARDVLISVSYRSGLGSDEDGIRDALAAIDKIGGREDV